MWKARSAVVWTRVRIPPAPQEAERRCVSNAVPRSGTFEVYPGGMPGNPCGSTGGGAAVRKQRRSAQRNIRGLSRRHAGKSLRLHLSLAEGRLPAPAGSHAKAGFAHSFHNATAALLRRGYGLAMRDRIRAPSLRAGFVARQSRHDRPDGLLRPRQPLKDASHEHARWEQDHRGSLRAWLLPLKAGGVARRNVLLPGLCSRVRCDFGPQ